MNLGFSLKTKTFLIILVPASILLFVIYLDYANLSALGRSAELILSKNYKSIRAAQQIRQHFDANLNRVLMRFFNDSAAGVPPEEANREIDLLLSICRDNITETGEKEIIDNLYKKFDEYVPIFASIPAGKDDESPDRQYTFLSLTASIISDLNALVLINEEAMEAADRKTREQAGRAQRYSMGLLFLALLFILVFSFVLAGRITRPLTRLAESLASVKEGTGEYPLISVESKDEIGFLSSEFNRLFERLKVYDQLSFDKLTAEKLKVLKAEEAKARFIGDLSHQLKTPMTSLSMGIGILNEKGGDLPPEKSARLIDLAREDCARLSALINELVDIARIDAMLKPVTKELLDIGKVIHESLRPLAGQAEERKIRIETLASPDLPPVPIDSLRFPWVITNLVGNAIRYTEKGGTVIFKAEKRGNRIYFQCIDRGVGIDARFIPMIFDRYTQFSEREKSGAIGLGLAIVKEIIEQHGGDISVESSIGKGTTFTFWLPYGDEVEG